jgi:rhodanese-related sulfurtransferase
MEGSGDGETISVEETRTRMGTDARILDIRPDEEWQSVGNIPGAISGADDAGEAAQQIDEDATVIVVDEDGERSPEVAERLREAGRDAVSLEGGMAAWADNGLPMQPTEDPALASDSD